VPPGGVRVASGGGGDAVESLVAGGSGGGRGDGRGGGEPTQPTPRQGGGGGELRKGFCSVQSSLPLAEAQKMQVAQAQRARWPEKLQ
jgi:hypothetical protein